MKYKTRLIRVEAIQYNGRNVHEVDEFIESNQEISALIRLNDFVVILEGEPEIFSKDEFNIIFERDHD